MKLVVNGELRAVEAGTSVATLVDDIAPSPKGIAVARNGDVVPRSTWTDVILEPDDRIEVLEAAQGG